MFDMNNEQFDAYNEQESQKNHEVYQMYEELMNIVQKGIGKIPASDLDSDLEEEGSSPDDQKEGKPVKK